MTKHRQAKLTVWNLVRCLLAVEKSRVLKRTLHLTDFAVIHLYPKKKITLQTTDNNTKISIDLANCNK